MVATGCCRCAISHTCKLHVWARPSPEPINAVFVPGKHWFFAGWWSEQIAMWQRADRGMRGTFTVGNVWQETGWEEGGREAQWNSASLDTELPWMVFCLTQSLFLYQRMHGSRHGTLLAHRITQHMFCCHSSPRATGSSGLNFLFTFTRKAGYMFF